tara:strand:- start:1626 stop:1898 length:273 start_codon:yes stop_codon:yes gene_type:complete
MTVKVYLKPDVASVLAQLLMDGSCCWNNEIASRLSVEEVERMDRELAKLARYISSHAPGNESIRASALCRGFVVDRAYTGQQLQGGLPHD